MPYWNQSAESVPTRAAYFGQSGWFKVPMSWDVECDSNGQWWATSPAGKRYAAKRNIDGALLFQDALLDLQT